MLVVEDAVGEEALLEVEPEAFDRVEFRLIGRQMDEGDVVGRLQPPGDVPSGFVEQQHDENVGRLALGEGIEIEAHHLGVGPGQDERESVVGAGADGAADVDRFEALVGAHDRSDALLEPDMGGCVLSARHGLRPGTTAKAESASFVPFGDALHSFGEPLF